MFDAPIGEKLRNRPPTGNDQIRGDLSERFEHKAAFMGTRMREHQIRQSQNRLPVDNEIEVQGPRPPPQFGSTVSAKITFDRVKEDKQRFWRQERAQERSGVQKVRLLDGPDWGRFKPR